MVDHMVMDSFACLFACLFGFVRVLACVYVRACMLVISRGVGVGFLVLRCVLLVCLSVCLSVFFACLFVCMFAFVSIFLASWIAGLNECAFHLPIGRLIDGSIGR